LIAPLSTATVTSRQPVLRWLLAEGSDGARVEICRDRGCNEQVTAFNADAESGSPAEALPSGTLFWRAFGRSNGALGLEPTPTWQFNVGARSAPVQSSWGTTPDVNGDGFGDALITETITQDPATHPGNSLAVYLGSASGIAAAPEMMLTHPNNEGNGLNLGYGHSVASAGDVDGDGRAEVIVSVGDNQGLVYVYAFDDGALRLSTPLNDSVNATGPAASAGDVNGDGYADVIIGAPLWGSPGAWPSILEARMAWAPVPSKSWRASAATTTSSVGN
jgi:hypothetical protein